MFRHILVPLDQSSDSERALVYALEIVKPGGRVILLTVLEDLLVYRYGQEIRYPASVEAEIIDKAAIYLQKAAAPLLKAGLQVECRVRAGRPIRVIADLAAKRGVEAIVMTTRNPGGLRRLIFGSVARGVMKRADCPVLVVPPEVEKVAAV